VCFSPSFDTPSISTSCLQVLVPLLNAEIDHTGPLAALIQDRGGLDKLKADLKAAGVSVPRIEYPAPPGEQMAIAL